MYVIMIEFVHKNNNLALNIIFQVFYSKKNKKKMELIQHIKHDEEEENS